jgi:hypothetical protein
MSITKLIKSCIFILGVLSIAIGCDYNKEEILYPIVEVCDTVDSKFSSRVNTIFQSNCVVCHSLGGSQEDYPLTNFEQISVDPDLAYERMTDASDPMPPTGLIDPCDAAAFKKWIDNGKLNN